MSRLSRRFALAPLVLVMALACRKSQSHAPTPPAATARHGQRVVKLARGASEAYAVLDDGTVHRWGEGESGPPNDVPVPVAGLVGKFVDVSSYMHTCAVNEAGEVWCWGANTAGQVGNGTGRALGPHSRVDAPVRAMVDGVKSVCVSGLLSCALHRTGAVSCWGHGPWGAEVAHQVPVPMPGLTRVTSIACGGEHVCAVDEDGVVKCVGRGRLGVLGDGKRGDFYRTEPVVARGARATGPLVTDTCFSCAAVVGDRVECWGLPFSRRCADVPMSEDLDTSQTAEVPPPHAVFELPHVVELQTQNDGVCARTAEGHVYCWGAPEDKSMVRSDTAPVFGTTPTRLEALDGATHLTRDCGSVLRDGGRRDAIVCWGQPIASFAPGPGVTSSWNVRLAPTELAW